MVSLQLDTAVVAAATQAAVEGTAMSGHMTWPDVVAFAVLCAAGVLIAWCIFR